MRRHTWHVLPPSAERVVRCQRRRHLMCTCACVPEHAHGEMSAPKAGPSKQKRHEGASGCIVDEDAEGFSERVRSRPASSGTAVPTGGAPARRTSAPSRARRIEAPRARVGPGAPRRRAPRRDAPRRTADASSKTGRPDAHRPGNARAARVIIRSESARVFRACSARVEDAGRMPRRALTGARRSAKCTYPTCINPRFGNALFGRKRPAFRPALARSRYVRHSSNHVTRVPTAVHSSIPRGAFSFWRDTSRIEPPSRARATVAPTTHTAATARKRASLARPRAGLAASRAAHVGAGARVRPLRSAGCD